MTTYPPTGAWGGVDHVDGGGVGEHLAVADGVGHVHVALHAALLELHVVLGEGARLVREHVLHLQTRLCCQAAPEGLGPPHVAIPPPRPTELCAGRVLVITPT